MKYLGVLDITTQRIVAPINQVLDRIIPNIPAAIFILLVGIIFIRLLSHLISFSLRITRLQRSLVDIIVKLIDIALWIFLGIACLQFLGLNNVALAVSGSFAFIVLGISQGGAAMVGDTLSGLGLARDRDFAIGDHIKVIDKKIEGIIEQMDIRRTRIRTLQGKKYIVPNSMIDKSGWVLVARRRDLLAANQKKTKKKGEL